LLQQNITTFQQPVIGFSWSKIH